MKFFDFEKEKIFLEKILRNKETEYESDMSYDLLALFTIVYQWGKEDYDKK